MIPLILTKEKDLSFIYGQWLLPRRVFPRVNGKLENLLKVLSAILLEEIQVQNRALYRYRRYKLIAVVWGADAVFVLARLYFIEKIKFLR
jgi:hypothetical protein